MSTITPHFRTVQQLLQSQSYSIDDYQREYKWEKENIDELINDLEDKFLNCYKPGHETKAVANYEDYFLGSIIVSKRGIKNYLIDGQQRVTSLTLLLIHLLHLARERSLPVASSLEPLIFSDNLGEPQFNLDIPERLPVIEALYFKRPYSPEGKDESIQTMCARYEDIIAADLPGDLGEALPHFIYWLMTKVGLIEISTDNDNYAYAIFETMNDRGKQLSPVDMLKAYLLSPIEGYEKRRAANQVWKQQVWNLLSWGGAISTDRDANAIKSWFRAQYADTVRERKAGATDKDWEVIGTAFHRWVRDNHQRLKLGTETANLSFVQDDFPFFAKTYIQILDASRNYTPGLEAIYYNAHNEFTWQYTVLLAPLCVADDPVTVRKKLAITASYLDIWMMRRVVNYIRVGYSTTNYSMYLLVKDIRNKTLPDLVEILTRKLAEDDVTFDGSPTRGRLGIKDLYLNQFTRWYIYHLLARITSYIEFNSGKGDHFAHYVNRNTKNPFDIEHIWADNFEPYREEFVGNENDFRSWRGHIAGLLLLPADVNRSLQDKPFEYKVTPHYADQNLYAASLSASSYQHKPKFLAFCRENNLPFTTYEHFGKNEQLERRELIHALVNQIWSPERLKQILESQANLTGI